jgi:Domain of unknown function (DUF4388)
VSLEGTLETIALPDVLALLSVTAKTGELRIESGGGVGRVWLDAGRVAGYDVGSQRSAVDALFALLRLKDGSFKFGTGTELLNPVEPQEVAPLMEEAEERLVQWPGISAVVPSLSSTVNLEESVDGEVNLSPVQWGLVAQFGSGRAVGDVLDARNFGEFDGCKAVKELVELGLVKVDHVDTSAEPVVLLPTSSIEDFAPPAEGNPPTEDNSPAPEYPGESVEYPAESLATNGWSNSDLTSLSEVWNDETGQVESGQVEIGQGDAAPVEDEPVEAGHPVNRGLLLKFLGSARS